MIKWLLYIKHHFGFFWQLIEYANNSAFSILYQSKLKKALLSAYNEVHISPYSSRELDIYDANILYDFIHSQNSKDLQYFQPHKFDHKSIIKQLKNNSLLMMGIFDGEKLIGYYFLRFFINKKCFVGRLIDKNYRGKGIGLVMNNIMYETAWSMEFRCLSTISCNNKAVIHAHAKNPHMIILKNLPNEFLLVEFIRKEDGLNNQY